MESDEAKKDRQGRGNRVRIAIVGLGTAGVCMLDSLEQVLGDHPEMSLTLYDDAKPWQGRVFQADSPCIIANAPVDAMSVRHGDSAHAERWLVERGHLEPGKSHDLFLPRGLYGDYMAEHAGELLQSLRRRGWRVELVEQRASSIEPKGPLRYAVEAEGRRDEFDFVILCAGGSVRGGPVDLDRYDEYIADPYPTFERLAGIPSDAAVGVMGSGLTAVDVAVALKERGHSGRIRMYSRSGALPLVRRPGPAWKPKHLTAGQVSELASSKGFLRLADAEQLVGQEVQAWGGQPRELFPPARAAGARAWLHRQLENPHDHTDLETFIFQKSVPAVWQEIWFALSPGDQRRILETPSVMRSIMSRCCPMPRTNAEKILAMLDSGQLETKSGLKSISRGLKTFEVHLATGAEQADYIVNAVTPPVYGIHPKAEPLVDSAVQHGLARRHHAGGLKVTATSSAILGSRSLGGLYALGDLTRGAFFFTFGLPVLVRRSADIARAIHDDIHQNSGRYRDGAGRASGFRSL
ncbi:FAD/NAD(P)-binding protein [Arthrobacter bambusae]|nr:FAD/NAD(P)-binding protein [Arthrobacter bambusae]